MRLFQFIFLAFLALSVLGCESEEDDLTNTEENSPTNGNQGPFDGSTPSWSVDFWKRDNANTYLDLTNTIPLFCSNGEQLGGNYSEVNWVSSTVGYFILGTLEGDFEFELRKDDNQLIVSPYDPEIQATHNPAYYSSTSSFPCDSNGNTGSNGNDENNDNDDNGMVAIKFWTIADFGCGNISVTLTNVGTRQISGYFNSTPNCNTTQAGGYFSNLAPGTYSYSATCSNYSWNGSVNLEAHCTTFELRL